jgi:hypothetical protein
MKMLISSKNRQIFIGCSVSSTEFECCVSKKHSNDPGIKDQ